MQHDHRKNIDRGWDLERLCYNAEMTLTAIDWQNRFIQQARWTQDLRAYLYESIGLEDASHILDLGCGTGSLTDELLAQSKAILHGLDISRTHLKLIPSKAHLFLTQGDGHHTPYPDEYFDVTLCHFTLLWVANPVQVLHEMVRITRPGGAVLALAEPDYGGRIDYPTALDQLGKWQKESLQAQGADPLMGRKLAEIFNAAGLETIETGVLGGQWSDQANHNGLENWKSEWGVLESDFNTTSEIINFSEVLKFKELDKTAWETGQRVLFVPTFYARGKVGSVT